MYEPQRVGMQMPSKIEYVYDQPLFSNPLGGTGLFPGMAESSIAVDLGNPTDIKNMLLRINANSKLNNLDRGLIAPVRDVVAPRMQDYRNKNAPQ
jgi:hypothetical protein